jgi:chemotaxis protein MotB
MAKKKKGGHEEHESSERWLLTYADMITLLMAFFIMMYSMSVMNLAKFNQVAFSIRSGFGGALKGGQHLLKHEPRTHIQSKHPSAATAENKLRDAKQRLANYAIMNNMQDTIIISNDKRGLVVSIAVDGLLFDAGSAQLRASAVPVLKEVAGSLKVIENEIMVEGHTCTLPIATKVYPSNWELSAARASSVVRFFQKLGVSGERLLAVGYGESRPRVPNDTARHRAMNRRVNIVILDSRVEPVGEGAKDTQAETGDVEEDTEHVRPVLPKVWVIDEKAKDGAEAAKEGEHE